MFCKKCNKDHDGSFGSGIYCSRECANSRNFNEESKKKKSEANKKRYIEKGSWGGMLLFLDDKERKEITNKRREKCKKDLLECEFESLSYDRKRKRLFLEQDNKCSECGIKEWRGKKIPLEIEHKNGNHQDNSRENLIALCPNCHSITPTWRGRNKSKDSRWMSSQEIYNLSKSGLTIRQILIQMGFAAKGDNYIKVRRILEKYEELPLTY